MNVIKEFRKNSKLYPLALIESLKYGQKLINRKHLTDTSFFSDITTLPHFENGIITHYVHKEKPHYIVLIEEKDKWIVGKLYENESFDNFNVFHVFKYDREYNLSIFAKLHLKFKKNRKVKKNE